MGNNDELEIDLLEVFFYLKKRIVTIILSGIVCAVIAGLCTVFLMVPQYRATSKLYILASSTSITSFADIQIGSSLTKDFVQLVQSRPVADQVIENLNLDTTYNQLLQQMTFENPSDTRILNITCEDPNPVLAKEIVDEFAEVSRVRISDIMKTDAPTVAEYGYVAEHPVSPNKTKNVAVGGLLGIFLSCGIFIILFLMDDTVKTAEDVEKYLNMNTLTAIPLQEGAEKNVFSKKKKTKASTKKGAR